MRPAFRKAYPFFVASPPCEGGRSAWLWFLKRPDINPIIPCIGCMGAQAAGMGTVALVIMVELLMAYMIHDNLTLNITRLIHPSAAISHWQAG